MSPRTGRPKSATARDKLLQVRMGEQEMALLDSCAQDRQTTKAEIIREGITLVRKKIDAEKQK